MELIWIAVLLIGVFGGIAFGVMLYCIFHRMQKHYHPQIIEHSQSWQFGVTNLSFIGDDQVSSFADPSPDYSTVMSRNVSSDQNRTRGFFSRFLKRSPGGMNSNGSTAASGMEEPPPSYSSVVPHTDVDFFVRCQAVDDVILFIKMTDCPKSGSQ
ncbi:hypothetical protein JTE90_006993 [Oedothorax gibbosus]|uniref:Uncharacterized protein n=1 Tax=Oedothorax gibbosus TaxID=931172 RepID=A0AAV6V8Y1_9ARAC|nr:hypothetical protein JTE90_006993 [Oedothorax gibbosus]